MVKLLLLDKGKQYIIMLDDNLAAQLFIGTLKLRTPMY
jgi:hypothetical protein